MEVERIDVSSASEEQTVAIGYAIAQALLPGSVVVLEGELGTGKTRLTWGIAEGLGLERKAVSSPTYALVHEYALPDGLRLIHADAYRMNADDADDFETLLGIGDQPDWIAIIEWASRIAEILPEQRIVIELSHMAGTMRRISIEGNRAVIDRFRNAMDGSDADG